MFIVLTDELLPGHAALDHHHQRMADGSNAIIAAQGAAVEARVGGALASLAQALRRHLAIEEHIMESMGFPWLAQHRRAHSRLVEEIEGLIEAHWDGAPARTTQLGLLHVFQRLYLHHAQRTDRRLARWLEKRKVPAAVEDPQTGLWCEPVQDNRDPLIHADAVGAERAAK